MNYIPLNRDNLDVKVQAFWPFLVTLNVKVHPLAFNIPGRLNKHTKYGYNLW